MAELINNHYAVEVPEGATEFGFLANCLCCKLPDSKPGRNHWLSEADDFMHQKGGEWEVVCTSKEATEEQAAGIVEEYRIRGNLRYEDYTREFMWQETAIDSLRSLLTSKGCDLNKNYLIVKKG